MSIPTRVLLAALAVLVATVLIPAASGSAATRYGTKVIVSLKFPAFHGKLKSAQGACTGNRTVKLYRVRSGPDKLLGTDSSADGGAWAIPIGKRLISGSYYAKATTRGNCGAGKSKVLPVD
jgi:hypothetical protein